MDDKNKFIVNIKPEERDKETLNKLREALTLYWSRGDSFDTTSGSIAKNLFIFELSFKSLTTYYLLAYEKTHFLNNEEIIKRLHKVIDIPDDIKYILNIYRKYANNFEYANNAKYGETGLDPFKDCIESKETDCISEKMFMFTWKNLQSFILENRKELLLSDDSVEKLSEIYDPN
jgi:hypothetical protein